MCVQSNVSFMTLVTGKPASFADLLCFETQRPVLLHSMRRMLPSLLLQCRSVGDRQVSRKSDNRCSAIV